MGNFEFYKKIIFLIHSCLFNIFCTLFFIIIACDHVVDAHTNEDDAIAERKWILKGVNEAIIDSDPNVVKSATIFAMTLMGRDSIMSLARSNPSVPKILINVARDDTDIDARKIATASLALFASDPSVRDTLVEILTYSNPYKWHKPSPSDEWGVRDRQGQPKARIFFPSPAISKDKFADLRGAAAKSLSSAVSDPSVRGALLKVFGRDHITVHSTAITSLVSVTSDPSVQSILIDQLMGDIDVCRAAAATLASAASDPSMFDTLTNALTTSEASAGLCEPGINFSGCIAAAITSLKNGNFDCIRGKRISLTKPQIRNALIEELGDIDLTGQDSVEISLIKSSTESQDFEILYIPKRHNRDQAARIVVEKLQAKVEFDPQLRDNLILSLNDDSQIVRFVAAVILSKVASEPRVRDAFIEISGDSNLTIRNFVKNILSESVSTPPVHDAIIKALKNGGISVRRATTAILETVASAPPVRDALIKALEDNEPIVRSSAASSLTSVASEPSVRDALIKALRDIKPTVRSAAAASLTMAASNPQACEALISTLGDIDPNVRISAATSLGKVASELQARNALINALMDSESKVRRTAATSLASAEKGQLSNVDSWQLLVASNRFYTFPPEVRAEIRAYALILTGGEGIGFELLKYSLLNPITAPLQAASPDEAIERLSHIGKALIFNVKNGHQVQPKIIAAPAQRELYSEALRSAYTALASSLLLSREKVKISLNYLEDILAALRHPETQIAMSELAGFNSVIDKFHDRIALINKFFIGISLLLFVIVYFTSMGVMLRYSPLSLIKIAKYFPINQLIDILPWPLWRKGLCCLMNIFGVNWFASHKCVRRAWASPGAPCQFNLLPKAILPAFLNDTNCLDGWLLAKVDCDGNVSSRLEEIGLRFGMEKSVSTRLHYIDQPCQLNGNERVTQLKYVLAAVREVIGNRDNVQIQIEAQVGGAGKSAAAFAIAQQLAKQTITNRLLAPVVPVLMEHVTDNLFEDVHRRLQLMLGLDQIDRPLQNALMKHHRVMVIFDAVSEMNADQQNRVAQALREPDLKIIMTTSRRDESQGARARLRIEPEPIELASLGLFLREIIKQRTEAGSPVVHNAMQRKLDEHLESIIERGARAGRVYPLLVVSFVDHALMQQLPNGEIDFSKLPKSWPEVIRQIAEKSNRAWLNSFEKKGQVELDTFHRCLDQVAYTAVHDGFVSRDFRLDHVIEALGDTADLLGGAHAFSNQLVNSGLVHQHVWDGKTILRFDQDRAAEYLAASHLLRIVEKNPDTWSKHTNELLTSPGFPRDTQGFLLGLLDLVLTSQDHASQADRAVLAQMEEWLHANLQGNQTMAAA